MGIIIILFAWFCSVNFQIQIYFLTMHNEYATTTMRIVEHRQQNMAQPGGLKHLKLDESLLRSKPFERPTHIK